MGILKRFTDIMSANVNALLDKAEDPSKMVDQYLRDLQSDLGKVKAETAAVMAEETKAKRELDACSGEIAKMQQYAEKAILAGNDEDARQFLTKKNTLTEKQASLNQAYTLAADNAAKMRQMHDKLCEDISALNAKRDSIKAKIQVAKTQEKVNKITSGMDSAKGRMSDLDRMEAKANKMLDEANAMARLNETDASGDMEDLMQKYDSVPSTAVEDELAALKAKLGK
ncbi:MAG: PspA/IM30 family protein [Lachnospiraceae bacterium]|nr:PspA/IM30 family protein [Lachnospiraceae bacterium]